jgi:ADP-heptose:LPS heptosyltransferase
LAGKHILIWTEQGFGDIFQFSRYALVLQSRGAAKVTLLTLEGKCKRLFEHSFAPAGIDVVDEVAMRNGLLVPAFDVHCPLMSLPFACKTNSIDKVPAHVPYLFAQPTAAQNWQEKIAQATTAQSVQPTQRVGLCWAGGSKLGDDAERSLTLAQFGVLVALTKTGGVQFFSLQMGEPAAQLQGLPMADLTAGLTDWADTAALVANLDLVIACDTAVAHLAAAMGKPTWILSRFNGCWRWLQERSDSPWYPSVRLFRQKTRSDWNGVMAEVANALKTLSS